MKSMHVSNSNNINSEHELSINILITAFQMRKPRHRKVTDLPKVTYLMSGGATFNLNMLVKNS